VTAWPVLTRFLVIGAVGAGCIGAIVGLALGLIANTSTAWFAVFEVGVPSALLGAVVGLAAGLVCLAVRRPTRARRAQVSR
jgi:hypothetical protein